MDELIKNEKLGDLYAYYGKLLTKGQQSYFEDYYYNDLSLGEIALNHQVSRQAVYDNLRRSSQALEKYEKTLQLKQDFGKFENDLVQALADLDQGQAQKAKQTLTKLLSKLRGE